MAKEKTEKKINDENSKQEANAGGCKDIKCPVHGELKMRGRRFEGTVIRKFPTRVVIEFERTLYIRKYERYAKSKTKIHAWLPACMAPQVSVGDYIEVSECRPLSKIVSFVMVKKIRSASEEAKQ